MQRIPDRDTLPLLLSVLADKTPKSSIASVVNATTINYACELLSRENYISITEQLSKASDVKNMIDFMLYLLHDPRLSKQDAIANIKRRARRFMFKVISRVPVIPTSLIVTGVRVPAEWEYVGGGGFGSVFKGELRGAAVALKVLCLLSGGINVEIPQAQVCATIPGEDGRVFLVSPYMKNGTLARWRKKAHPSMVEIEERVILEVAQGIEYIHSEGAVHGDLRGENVLLDANFHVQIADFGLTRLSEATNTQSGAFHLNFAAPELLGFSSNGDSPPDDVPARTQMSDVYAFGGLYYEIHYDRLPFDGRRDIQIMTLISRGVVPPRLDKPPLSDEAWDVIQRCWAREVSKRPKIKDVTENMKEARIRKEEEEKERLRKEGEEKERLRKESEEKEQLRKEGEEKERLREEEEQLRKGEEEKEWSKVERQRRKREKRKRKENEKRILREEEKVREEESRKREEEERRQQEEGERRQREEEERRQREEEERRQHEEEVAKAKTSVEDEASRWPSSPLTLACPLKDLGSVTYPAGISSPSPELNARAKEGKFRYDREFLLQFMSICKEKPESLPALDAIGLEPVDQLPLTYGNWQLSGPSPLLAFLDEIRSAGSIGPPRSMEHWRKFREYFETATNRPISLGGTSASTNSSSNMESIVLGSATEETPALGDMSEEAADAKIKEDVKEFFNIRNLDEAEVYFGALPLQYHHVLVNKLVSSAVESKEPDARLVADLFTRAKSKGLCSPDAFEEGLRPTSEMIEDTMIDAPKAWTLFMTMVNGAELDQGRRVELANKLADNDKFFEPILS